MKKFAKVMTALSLSAACVAGTAFTALAEEFDNTNMISVQSREDGSGTRGAFIELFGIEQEDEEGNKVDMTTAEAAITNSTSVMMTAVANDVYAIGYISLGSLDDTVKAVKIDGTAPSVEAVADGSYKIARPFNIAVMEDTLTPVDQDLSANSKLLSLDVEEATDLKTVNLGDNVNLQKLVFSSCPNYVVGDVSKFVNLVTLLVDNTATETLDVSANVKLRSLY